MYRLFKDFLGVLTVAPILLISCKPLDSRTESAVSLTGIAPKSTRVKTVVSRTAIFNNYVESTGKVKAYREQKVMSPSNGIISICNVSNNSTAKRGALLAQFDLAELQFNLRRAELEYFNAGIEFESSMLSWGGKLISDTIQRKVEGESGLAQARLDLESAKHELSKGSIMAPFTGLISNVRIQAGAVVRAGDELFTIYSNDDLYVETRILETYISTIHANQRAEVSVLADPTKTYHGYVYEINPVVDEGGLITIRIRLRKGILGLLPGMNASILIKVPKAQTLAVPKDAIVIRNGRPVVFTFEDGLAKWNYVVLGLDNGNEVEIKEGLSATQKVIVTNNVQLAHGSPVIE